MLVKNLRDGMLEKSLTFVETIIIHTNSHSRGFCGSKSGIFEIEFDERYVLKNPV